MALSFEQMRAAIRAALTAMLGDPCCAPGPEPWELEATFQDRAIVCKDEKTWSYPVTFDAAGNATLGTPEQVAVDYKPITEGGGRVVGPLTSKEGDPEGSRWSVVVIEAGTSKNRNRYRPEVLEAAAPLYEGARCFWNHSETVTRDARDIAGFISDVRFGVIEGRRPRHAVMGVLNVTSTQLRSGLLEAHRLGKPDLYGLSHDARPTSTKAVSLPEGVVRDVEGIAEVVSVDVVSHPAAGGRVVRLVAGAAVGDSQEDLQMFEQKLKRLRESRPDLAARLSANPTEPEVDALLLEGLTSAAPATTTAPPVPAPVAPAPATVTISEADARSFRAAMHELRVDKALNGRTLPEPQKAALRESLLARQGISDAELSLEVDRWVKAASQAAAPAPGASGSGAGRTVENVADQADKLAEGLDGFFFASLKPEAQATYREQNGGQAPKDGFRSYREAYVEITGDRKFTGSIHEAVGLRRFEGRVSEALTSASWAQIQGDSIRRALLADYGTQVALDQWREVVSNIGSISDFRTNRRMRMGGYGNLATVNESGNYDPLTSPGDEEATYALSKKGGVESVTLEMIANDDVGAIRRIPTNLSRAAKRTLYKAVFDLLASNATCTYDSVALAHLASHGNLISTALSAANVSAARQLMAAQTAYGNADEFLDIYPVTIVVPPELEETAWRIANSPVANTSNKDATEPSYQRALGIKRVITCNYWTDADNYWLVADPMDIPTIEVGFWQGNQTPEVFVQDQPNVGSLFTADKTDYKIRFIFGVCILDHRGFVGGIV